MSRHRNIFAHQGAAAVCARIYLPVLFATLSVLMLLPPAGAQAQPVSDIPAAFADIGYGARPMGMGGAFLAIADDANAVMWNPAGLVRLPSSQLTGARRSRHISPKLV